MPRDPKRTNTNRIVSSSFLLACHTEIEVGSQAIEMENTDMAFPVTHTLEERRYGLLIVGCGERSREVETE
jgi:hypothetical protein